MASISLCSKILLTIASPAFKIAYEKGVSPREEENELSKLKVTIEAIQIILRDAENKQEGSDDVKKLIQRLKEVSYDAEDFFDEVLTEDLLMQQMMNDKVRVSCSILNLVVSRNSIDKKVKAIRERLDEISIDMDQYRFIQGQPKIITRGENYTARCSIEAKFVIGRDVDKDSILEMLFKELSDSTDAPVVIAIDGIGGMGKTTLAHLIYTDAKVNKFFEKRWFVCISDSFGDKKVLEKIYQSICEKNYSGLTLIQLEDKIKKSLEGKKYLLILDGVGEENHGKWTSRMNLLKSGANGSKIIVTTRHQLVVSDVGAVRVHNLQGLSEDDSWNLFKKLAFVSCYESDPRRESVGREFLKRCKGLPLAIWCMGGLLCNRTIQEWEEIERAGLPTLREKHNDELISILKLSYDHLPSNLKQCFTYCCLFPKDYTYTNEELIYHWVAQGYINLDEEEHSFMYLLNMGFFQEVNKDELNGVYSCKMHDIVHDLAVHLSDEESIMQNDTTLNMSSCTRYVSLSMDGEDGGLWDIPTSLLNFKSIRSCMMRGISSRPNQPNLDQLCSNFKLLRTLTLSNLRIEHIPPSIGELKLVRYLDLSGNNFARLPDSIANLVNLLILNLERCRNFNVWPLNFKNLINLKSLKLKNTDMLLSMPEGIEGMTSLQNLSDFKAENWSQFHELTGLLKRLRGNLLIACDERMKVGDEQSWQLPASTSLQYLHISFYPGNGIWGWGNNEIPMKLEHLTLESCTNVKYLPPMSCLPCLKWLEIRDMPDLEYMEEQEEVNPRNPSTSQKFFPCLEKLVLFEMLELKGWRREVAAGDSGFLEFSKLFELTIHDCPSLELNAFPQCPHLQKLQLDNLDISTPTIFCSSLEEVRISRCELVSGIPGEALTSLQKMVIEEDYSLKSLHLASPHLLDLEIGDCDELVSVALAQRKSLRSLTMWECKQLKSLHIEGNLDCSELSSLQQLVLRNGDSVVMKGLLSSCAMSSLYVIIIYDYKGPISLPCIELTSLQECHLKNIDGLQSLHLSKSPHLRSVTLENCVGLTSVEVKSPFEIHLKCCSELKNFCIAEPTALRFLSIISSSLVDWASISNLYECRCITGIYLNGVDGAFTELLFSSSSFRSIGSLTVALPSLETFSVINVCGLKSLNLKSPHLRTIYIDRCEELTSVEIDSPFSYSHMKSCVNIYYCFQLNNVRIPRPIALQELHIQDCSELILSTGVDWGSLTKLEWLLLYSFPPLEKLQLQLPQRILQRHALGLLRINNLQYWWKSKQGA